VKVPGTGLQIVFAFGLTLQRLHSELRASPPVASGPTKQTRNFKMDNVALLKEAYANFAQGNIEGVLAMFDPAIEWNECKGMPFITGDGRFVGGPAVVTNIFAKIPEHFDGFSVEAQELFGSGDRVVMVGAYTGTNKATGKQFRAAAVHIWNFRNGKAVQFIQVVDTAEIIDPKI
jgi:ketosteroid isomerase-like protein